MKVLQLINSLETGGAEKLVTDTVPMYQTRGIETDVMLLNNAKTPLLQQLQAKTSGKILLSSHKSVYNPLHILSVARVLKNYDLVHVHLFPALYWTAITKILTFSKTKMVYTEHSTHNRRRDQWIFKILDRLVYPRYDKIITIADQVDANVKQHLNLAASRFVKVYNGVDTEAVASAEAYPAGTFFEPDAKIILQISSFRHPKDQPTLIRALSHLPENVKLLLVGEGPTKIECEALVKELSLENRVQFLGVRMDAPRLLRSVFAVVLSSSHEGLSLSSIEGMASGKPFLASNAPGLIEVVKDAGILFETGNDKALASAIDSLLNDSDYYNEIAQKCVVRAAKYDISHMINGYISVYQSLMQNK